MVSEATSHPPWIQFANMLHEVDGLCLVGILRCVRVGGFVRRPLDVSIVGRWRFGFLRRRLIDGKSRHGQKGMGAKGYRHDHHKSNSDKEGTRQLRGQYACKEALPAALLPTMERNTACLRFFV